MVSPSRERQSGESANQRATNLPIPGTRFIGRGEHLGRVLEVLGGEGRLVTLVGAPGTGKSRLAIEVGRALRALAPEEAVWLCDLSEAADAEQIGRLVARVLGVVVAAEQPVEQASERLVAAMRNQGPMVLIVDNAEHVVDSLAEGVEEWLEQTVEMQIVVTSRQRLGLKNEQCVDVGPLELEEAVALFEDRARLVRREFALVEGVRDAVVELVGHLDGIPLAIELAAARIQTLPPVEMLRRISSRFRLLQDRRGRGERDATLEAAIEWSWNLLDGHERRALVQCAVFRGGFSLEAAEEVVDLGEGPGVPWVVDVIEALTEKSLLRREEPAGFAGEVRFGIFESIREFAARQVEHQADRVVAEERHGHFFIAVGQKLAGLAQGRDGACWLERLELERANLSVVVDRFADGEPSLALEAILVLDVLMRYVGPLGAHCVLLERASGLAAGAEPRQRLCLARGKLAMLRGELDEAAQNFAQARALVSGQLEGWALFHGAEVLRQQGRVMGAIEGYEAALTRACAGGDVGLERMVLAHMASCQVDREAHDEARALLARLQSTRPQENLYDECQLNKRVAYVQYYLGAYEEQVRYTERALELARQIGDRRQEGLCLQGLADCAFVRGDFAAAREAYGAALVIHERFGNRHYEGILRGNLGGAFHRDDDLVSARRCYVDSLEIHRQTGARPYEAVVLFALGALEYEQGYRDRARHHFEASLAMHVELEQRSDEGALALCLGLLAIEAEDEGEAAEHLARGQVCLAEDESSGWDSIAAMAVACLEAWRGQGDKARTLLEATKRRQKGTTEAGILRLLESHCAFVLGVAEAQGACMEILEQVRRPWPPSGVPLVKRSLHARLIALWLERFVARVDGVAADSAPPSNSSLACEARLVVGVEGRWFTWAEEERVDLRRRRSIRLILDWLTTRRLEAPGMGTDVYTLFDVGWPGEVVEPETAGERVYWAVRTLRKLGLEDVLVTTDEGYLLNARIEVLRGQQ